MIKSEQQLVVGWSANVRNNVILKHAISNQRRCAFYIFQIADVGYITFRVVCSYGQ
ncbi:hypothetical protein ABIE27_002373 [Paenibacillus sp. 4624]|uniref:hypothetical protein n=1 Tax=Paenibacillus sp. 4624 TaxID=3156453 RepID=UPI003D1EF640